MATTIKQDEAIPSAYPATPTGLSTAAAALDPKFIWQRLESYVAHRWTSRAVVWTVEGPGPWVPPLTPATITTTEIWRGDEWQEITLSPSPLGGYVLNGSGPYRLTGAVGPDEAATPPAAVLEAFRRLAEYAAQKGKPGVTSESVSAGTVSISTRRSASWVAQAISGSGAGDLLRPYRRA